MYRPRYFVSSYTDGPSTGWNVIDRHTQEWVRRFPRESAAAAYAAKMSTDHVLSEIEARAVAIVRDVQDLNAALRQQGAGSEVS